MYFLNNPGSKIEKSMCSDIINMSVEQVYLMAPDHRLHCNYLATIQIEKLHLERQLNEIRMEQRELSRRLAEVCDVERRSEADDGFGKNCILCYSSKFAMFLEHGIRTLRCKRMHELKKNKI